MISSLAIATVTAALRLMLQNAVNESFSGAEVVSGHPRDFASAGKKTGINLFLYQVAHNAAWRNRVVTMRLRDDAPPEQRKPDQVARVPVIPLNLYYVISVYGDERTYEPHRLLGAALAALHMAAQLLPEALESVAGEFPADAEQEIAVGQFEPIKLNPVQLNLEELSKLWSVFFQVPYALSVAYEASVALLAADRQQWLPVASRATLNRPDRAEEEARERPTPGIPEDPGRELDPWRRGLRAPAEEARRVRRSEQETTGTPDAPEAGPRRGDQNRGAP
jgi:hypothetical protein